MSKSESIVIFCDGACSGNPGPGGWGTIVIFPNGKVTELGGFEASTTNNKMEMIAILRGLELVSDLASGSDQKVTVYSDSVYVLKGITEWIHGWRRRGWKTAEGADVANIPIWEELGRVAGRFKRGQITWGYVPGHKGYPGNERCDEIAVAFSQQSRPSLYKGPLASYAYDVFQLPADTSIPELKFKNGEKKVAYSYLSIIGGIAMKHSSWKECEGRVKGQSGARFKKAMTPEEEIEILKSWGVDPTKVKG